MNFCQSNITSVPQATATHSLRETTLDACALGVELGVFLSLFTLASLLQRQKLLFPVDRQNPAISSLLPTATLFSVRASDLPFFPIKAEVGGGEALACLRLPGRIRPRRATQLDAILLLAAHDQIGIDVSRVHQMDGRQQLFGGEFLMDLVNYFVI